MDQNLKAIFCIVWGGGIFDTTYSLCAGESVLTCVGPYEMFFIFPNSIFCFFPNSVFSVLIFLDSFLMIK